jgi:hypothetical protein
MTAPKKSKSPVKKSKAPAPDNITVDIPKNKAAGGAAGAVVGGIVGGPVGAVVGGVVGASLAGNTAKVKKAISEGVTTVRKSGMGKTVSDAVHTAGKKIAKAYEQAKAKVQKLTTRKANVVAKKVKVVAKKAKTAAKTVSKAVKKSVPGVKKKARR